MDAFLFFCGFLYVMLFIIALMCSRRTFIINTGILALLSWEVSSALNDPHGNSFAHVFIFFPFASAVTGFLAGAFACLLLLYKKAWMSRPIVRSAVFWSCLMFLPIMTYWFAWPQG